MPQKEGFLEDYRVSSNGLVSCSSAEQEGYKLVERIYRSMLDYCSSTRRVRHSLTAIWNVSDQALRLKGDLEQNQSSGQTLSMLLSLLLQEDQGILTVGSLENELTRDQQIKDYHQIKHREALLQKQCRIQQQIIANLTGQVDALKTQLEKYRQADSKKFNSASFQKISKFEGFRSPVDSVMSNFEFPQENAKMIKKKMSSLEYGFLKAAYEGLGYRAVSLIVGFNCDHIKSLNLRSNDVGSEGLRILTSINWLSLTTLNLQDNDIDRIDWLVDHIKEVTNLNLSKNKLSELPDNIRQLQKLCQLGISHNQFKRAPKQLLELRELRKVRMYQQDVKLEEHEIIIKLKKRKVEVLLQV